MKVLLTVTSILIILTILMTLTMVISKKSKMSREKNSPFECGFKNISSPRKSFSTHVFLITTLFLIFDIEISIILPMFSTKMVKMNEWVISSLTVIIILIMGLLHEWNNGMLEWTK